MSPLPPESFTADEIEILSRYFTNVDAPVFALVGLPEVVKGALFARYSRSAKSLRRLFLDEFAADLDHTGPVVAGEEQAAAAARLYDKVFVDFGDDSVAQLGGAHVACEGVSNVLTKVLEWGRLGAYLEQSTRYIAYTDRLADGRWRYTIDPDIDASPLGARYRADLDAAFADYAACYDTVRTHMERAHPNVDGDPPGVWRAATRAKALDVVRGLLPAAAMSNVGIFASGQAYEALLVRMRSLPLPEAQTYAAMLLTELRKVIPSFVRRVDLPDRGTVTSAYLADVRAGMDARCAELFADLDDPGAPPVRLVGFDPAAEVKVLAQMCYPHTHLGLPVLEERVRAMTTGERLSLVAAYEGDRTNRRHKPGRALEHAQYRFDVLADYGAFRDLQRHRMCTIEWQPLDPRHGYEAPDVLAAADPALPGRYDAAMARSAALHDALAAAGFVAQAPYAVALGFRVRFSVGINARAAMQMLELRSQPQGHISYRRVAQEMHRQIADVAGHRALAAMMRFVDHSGDGLGRLDAERRVDGRRTR